MHLLLYFLLFLHFTSIPSQLIQYSFKRLYFFMFSCSFSGVLFLRFGFLVKDSHFHLCSHQKIALSTSTHHKLQTFITLMQDKQQLVCLNDIIEFVSLSLITYRGLQFVFIIAELILHLHTDNSDCTWNIENEKQRYYYYLYCLGWVINTHRVSFYSSFSQPSFVH